jgi:hypothetical protein
MQSLAEFMAESFHSNTPLTWDLTGASRVIASENPRLSFSPPSAMSCRESIKPSCAVRRRPWPNSAIRLEGPIRVDPDTEVVLRRLGGRRR